MTTNTTELMKEIFGPYYSMKRSENYYLWYGNPEDGPRTGDARNEVQLSWGQSETSYDIRSLHPVDLLPGRSALIESKEILQMPTTYAGFIHNKSTLMRRSLVLHTAVIDPGFNGRLQFLLQNLTGRTVSFARGMPIAACTFHACEVEAAYDGQWQEPVHIPASDLPQLDLGIRYSAHRSTRDLDYGE